MTDDTKLDKYQLILNNGKSIFYIEYFINKDKNIFIDIINTIDCNNTIYLIHQLENSFRIYCSKKIKSKLDKYFKTFYCGKTDGSCILSKELTIDIEDKYYYYVELK